MSSTVYMCLCNMCVIQCVPVGPVVSVLPDVSSGQVVEPR